MTLEDIVDAMVAQGVTVLEFRDFFADLGMGDHPYIAEVTQQLALEELLREPASSATTRRMDEADRMLDGCQPANPRDLESPDPLWSPEDADQLLKALSSPASEPIDEFDPWSPRSTEEALGQEEMASLAHACLQDGEFRYFRFPTLLKQLYNNKVICHFRYHGNTIYIY